MNTIDMYTHLLVFSGTVVQVVGQVLLCWIWMQGELMVYLYRHDNITIQAQVFRKLLMWADHALKRAMTLFSRKAVASGVVFAKRAICSKHSPFASMLIVVRDPIPFHRPMRGIGPPLHAVLHRRPLLFVARGIQDTWFWTWWITQVSKHIGHGANREERENNGFH